MSRKKAPIIPHTADDNIEVGHPCRYADIEMRTPRARRQSPSEPRTPSKGPSAKTICLDSPLATPKLDRRKTKYRSTSSTADDATQFDLVHEDENSVREHFVSPGFSQGQLEASAEAVKKENISLRWYWAEADADEQLLRRFDLETMYGPSMGISRAERWKRASTMGLSPPSEVVSALQRNPQSTMSVFDQRLDPEPSAL